MARPRKMSTEDMLAIVNEAYEEHGDASRLKCSFLAECAAERGFDVKAYDFRRNPVVRARIEELGDLSPFFTKGTSLAYKGLDVDAFIIRNRNPESLKNALLVLDGEWRKIYDRAYTLLKERDLLKHDLSAKTLDHERSERERMELSSQTAILKSEQKDLIIKNRYLTGMVKKHLYPAIANEILKNEGSLESIDTEVTQSAMDALTEADIPASFSKLVATDRQTMSREESLLYQMTQGIHRGDKNE